MMSIEEAINAYPGRLLALDLGSTTGWCFQNPFLANHGGTRRFDRKRGDNLAMRFVSFRAWLQELYQVYHFDVVVYESAGHHAGANDAHVFGGFEAALHEFCMQKTHATNGYDRPELAITTHPSTAIKKFAVPRELGGGRASKDRMVEMCRCRLGIVPQTHDEADARFLLCLELADKTAWALPAVESQTSK